MKIFYVILMVVFFVACGRNDKRDKMQEVEYTTASQGEIVNTTDTLESGVKTELDGLRTDAVDTLVSPVDTITQNKNN